MALGAPRLSLVVWSALALMAASEHDRQAGEDVLAAEMRARGYRSAPARASR